MTNPVEYLYWDEKGLNSYYVQCVSDNPSNTSVDFKLGINPEVFIKKAPAAHPKEKMVEDFIKYLKKSDLLDTVRATEDFPKNDFCLETCWAKKAVLPIDPQKRNSDLGSLIDKDCIVMWFSPPIEEKQNDSGKFFGHTTLILLQNAPLGESVGHFSPGGILTAILEDLSMDSNLFNTPETLRPDYSGLDKLFYGELGKPSCKPRYSKEKPTPIEEAEALRAENHRKAIRREFEVNTEEFLKELGGRVGERKKFSTLYRRRCVKTHRAISSRAVTYAYPVFVSISGE